VTTIQFRPRSFFATAAARWAAVYTLGLPATVRERRLQQVTSDIWEQEADGFAESNPPARVGFDIFERTVRGIPADILWRFQLEGPKVNINIPIERIAGALLLVLIILVFAGTSISGYDPARDTWADELERLGDSPAWQTEITVFFWMLCGLALIGTATVFYRAIQLASPGLALIEAFSFAAAGVLVLISAAMYRSMVSLAVEFKDNPAEPGVLTSSRSLMLAIETLQFGIIALLAVGVFSFALATHRQRLVPGWLSRLAAVSAVLLAGGIVSPVAGPLDQATWMLVMSGLVLMVVWLVIAGFMLLLNRKPAAPAAVASPA
jgi:hypothetical protein